MRGLRTEEVRKHACDCPCEFRRARIEAVYPLVVGEGFVKGPERVVFRKGEVRAELV